MVKVGVIGAGRWGRNHVRAYSQLGDCELVGLADPDKSTRGLASEYGIEYFSDYHDMLDSVDAVSVAVPTDAHYSVVKECLEAGVNVLVEKPITLHSSQARELIDLASGKNLLLTVGYIYRFNAAVKELKKILPQAGKVQYVTARMIHSNKPPRKDMGVIFNFAVHLVDILNYVLEDTPRRVFCKKKNFLSKDREDCAFITLDYGDYMAHLEVSWLHPLKKRDLWIICEREKIYVDLFEQIIVRHPIRVGLDKTESGREVNVEVNKNEPLKAELENFINCVKAKGGGESSELDAYDEYLTSRICELCLESAEKDCEVDYE